MAELYANPDLAEARTALHGAIAVLVAAGVGPERLQRLVTLSVDGFRAVAETG